MTRCSLATNISKDKAFSGFPLKVPASGEIRWQGEREGGSAKQGSDASVVNLQREGGKDTGSAAGTGAGAHVPWLLTLLTQVSKAVGLMRAGLSTPSFEVLLAVAAVEGALNSQVCVFED